MMFLEWRNKTQVNYIYSKNFHLKKPSSRSRHVHHEMKCMISLSYLLVPQRAGKRTASNIHELRMQNGGRALCSSHFYDGPRYYLPIKLLGFFIFSVLFILVCRIYPRLHLRGSREFTLMFETIKTSSLNSLSDIKKLHHKTRVKNIYYTHKVVELGSHLSKYEGTEG